MNMTGRLSVLQTVMSTLMSMALELWGSIEKTTQKDCFRGSEVLDSDLNPNFDKV